MSAPAEVRVRPWHQPVAPTRQMLRPVTPLTAATAVVAVIMVGLQGRLLPLGLTTAILAGLVLAPVWIPEVQHYRHARLIAVLTALTLLSGALLYLLAPRVQSPRAAQESVFALLGAACSVGLLLWARRVLPMLLLGSILGSALLLEGALGVSGSANPWKYQLSIPITLIVLSITSRPRSVIWPIGALLALGALGIATNSRSYFGFCLLAILLVLWQARPTDVNKRVGIWMSVGMAALAVIIFSSLASSILSEGYLGEDSQQRTVEQIQRSGSLLAGGRPEWFATAELMREQPYGFGPGAIPTTADVWLAKEGLLPVGITTDNGYVDNYLFGGVFKLHSVIADLWAGYGIPGLVLGIALFGVIVAALARGLRDNSVPAASIFMGTMALWFLPFGPISSNLGDVSIGLGLTLLFLRGEIRPHGVGSASSSPPATAGAPRTRT